MATTKHVSDGSVNTDTNSDRGNADVQYDHTQDAPLFLILVAAGVGMLAAAWLAPIPAVQVVLAVSSGLMLLLALSFRRLTVRDAGHCLVVEFGPLPLFRRRVSYSEIERVERGRTTVFDGWGIHLSPRGGWTWNLWGRDRVILQLARGRTLKIGTDDPQGLEAFLTGRLAAE